jgi:2-polyprenyl-3-methyl-5-hydroxy-6-metoxy-1,4-benzoquinol methylase
VIRAALRKVKRFVTRHLLTAGLQEEMARLRASLAEQEDQRLVRLRRGLQEDLRLFHENDQQQRDAITSAMALHAQRLEQWWEELRGLQQLCQTHADAFAALGTHLQTNTAEVGQRVAQLFEHTSQTAAVLRHGAEQVSLSLTAHGQQINCLAEMLGQAGVLALDTWKVRECEGLLRYLRKQHYLAAIEQGRLDVPTLETSHPVAVESNDTRFPRGAKNDNSICPRFNHKLCDLFGRRRGLRVLDLGCAGGGFVRSLIDDGNFAVGLEGSDFPKLNQAGEWGTIPHHLHTCDITKPFTLRDGAGRPLLFDAITAWELMEHIPEDGLPVLLDNIDRHLAADGLLLFSIATFVDKDDHLGVTWHVTVKSREWWVERFRQAGFGVAEQDLIGKDDWLRGAGNCRGDWHEDQDMGFHLVLRRTAAAGAAAA